MKNQPTQAAILRSPNSVFVSVQPPESLQQVMAAASQPKVWAKVATEIAESTIETPEPQSPTAEELLSETLPKLIEATRWGRYIVPGPASRVFDGSVFLYHDPCENFWDIYELSKGIFRDLGIRLSKPSGVWEARIPISVLTDKVFVESGLAGVEQTLMAHTGIDPSKVLEGIRHRQFAETARGMEKVKRMREGLADAVGILAIVAVGWAFYVVGGAV